METLIYLEAVPSFTISECQPKHKHVSKSTFRLCLNKNLPSFLCGIVIGPAIVM
jgi:hypothetical protein